MPSALAKPAIGVSGLVFNRQGDILLICRNQAPACGLWSLPGGRLEAGETMAAACAREVYEETGLQVEAQYIVAVVEREIEDFHYVVIDFFATLTAQSGLQPSAQSDVSAACWVSINKLADYSLVIGLEEIILRSYQHWLAGTQAGLFDADGNKLDFVLDVNG